MKVHSSLLNYLFLLPAVVAAQETFTPERVAYGVLNADPLLESSHDSSRLLGALSKDGIVSITDIPGFRSLKEGVMRHLHACIEQQGDSIFTRVQKDGTVRRTFSSSTIPGPGGAKPFDLDATSEQCQKFSQGLEEFRSKVGEATHAFADRLTHELGTSLQLPLMSTQGGDYNFHEVRDVVRNGEHLEHFHSYHKPSSSGDETSNKPVADETIDLHTDQGLFIAFTPGLMVTHLDDGTPDLSAAMKESDGFFIETSEGHRAMVEFSDVDDLVFMMGDGVNQYINPKLHYDTLSQSRKLRATPHSVGLATQNSSEARSWFGLMVLPPADAYSEKDGRSYGEVRHLLANSPIEDIPEGLGCSSVAHRALDGDENNDDCEEGYQQCWFRCMALADYGVSHDTCNETPDHAVKCVNPRGQVSDGWAHGDYYLACTDSVEEVTPFPKLPYYPQDNVTCTAEAWEDASDSAAEFDFMFDLTTEQTTAKFFWSVNEETGTVTGRLAFGNIFGWIGFGFASTDPDAGHNGMNGAEVIMATPGSEYNPVDGLDMDSGTLVAQYKIDENGSAFRHWSTPIDEIVAIKTSGPPSASVNFDGCFTTLDFEMSKIGDSELDLMGSNVMLWGANAVDTYMGYHGKNRALFTVEWATGKASFGKELMDDDEMSAGSVVSTHLSFVVILAVLGLALF